MVDSEYILKYANPPEDISGFADPERHIYVRLLQKKAPQEDESLPAENEAIQEMVTGGSLDAGTLQDIHREVTAIHTYMTYQMVFFIIIAGIAIAVMIVRYIYALLFKHL